MAELSEICGESRLWGGMHFTASISGATEVCDGIGFEAYDFITNIEAGNIDAFGDDEEIPDFEDEYKLELKLTKGKKKQKLEQTEKKEDKQMMYSIGDVFDNNNNDDKNQYFYFIISINVAISIITTFISIISCCYRRQDGNTKYEKVSNQDF